MSETDDGIIAILSDGLGSGVKANILASITAKVAITMLEGGATLDQVVETLGHTLPICQQRKVAYSTFTIIKMTNSGQVYLGEFDNPSTLCFRNGKVLPIKRKQRTIGSLTVSEASFSVDRGDVLLAVSDGVLHAGIGRSLDFGWLPQKFSIYSGALVRQGLNSKALCDRIIQAAYRFYGGMPRDDSSVMAIQVRRKRTVTIAVGPPLDRGRDQEFAACLGKEQQEKIVCGGTTASIIARELNKELAVELPSDSDQVLPPMAKLEGISLVTEGTITLSAAFEHLKKNQQLVGANGAIKLVSALKRADKITFLVGRAVNPAHQDLHLPGRFFLKQQLIAEIAHLLQEQGKQISITYF